MSSARRLLDLSLLLMLVGGLAACDDGGLDPLADCATRTVGSISAGESRSGDLSPASCPHDGERHADRWSLALPTATSLAIDLTSHAFDTYLVLTDAAGHVLDENDDGGQGLNSRLLRTLAAGEYRLLVTSFAPGERGRYHLAVHEVSICTPASAVGAITPGDAVSSAVSADDCLFVHGEPAQGFRLALEESTLVRLELANVRDGALLVVTDPSLQVLLWDETRNGQSAVVQHLFPAGEHLVWVTAYEGPAGAYQLAAAEVELESCSPVGELVLGESASGELTSGSCAAMAPRHAEVWALSVAEPATVQIDLTSDDFDTVLFLEDGAGHTLASDDDGGEGFNSRLVYAFGPGNYRVVATSFWGGETGAYKLLAAVAEGSSAQAAVAVEPTPAPEGTPFGAKATGGMR